MVAVGRKKESARGGGSSADRRSDEISPVSQERATDEGRKNTIGSHFQPNCAERKTFLGGRKTVLDLPETFLDLPEPETVLRFYLLNEKNES